jgi:hypothetical protein
MNLLKYSNSIGHMIMSIVCIATGLILVIFVADSGIKGFGVGLIGTVTGYWFITSSATSVAQEVIKQVPLVEEKNGSHNAP